MIAFIIGEVVELEENSVILDHQGMGFFAYVPSSVSNRVSYGEQIRLYTHMSVREDDISLYGFLSQDDLKTFRMLLNVNGIGPKAALGVLSALSADELRFAVLADDVAAISKAPGIGKKTAQKMILELKDKFNLEEAFEQKLLHNQSETVSVEKNNEAVSEAIQALSALGYSSSDALRAVKQIENKENMTVEQVLKAALKYL